MLHILPDLFFLSLALCIGYCIICAPSILFIMLLVKMHFLEKCPRVYFSNFELRWYTPLYFAIVGSLFYLFNFYVAIIMSSTLRISFLPYAVYFGLFLVDVILYVHLLDKISGGIRDYGPAAKGTGETPQSFTDNITAMAMQKLENGGS